MLEPWNDKSVLPPPVNTYLYHKELDIKNLKHICNAIILILSKQSPLHTESAIFSRFLYKYDKKFRNDIGYRYFKKVNTALRKYLGLAMIKTVQSFVDVLPNKTESPKYAPTRQMLEYVLIRTMTFSKLMIRITQCSKQAAIFYLNRIKKGESHWMCLMPYALLSRIWSMSFVLLQHSCKWYDQLYPFLKQLEYKGLNFLPNEYKLPVNLEDWNDMKNLNNAGRLEWSQKITINFNSFIDEDGEGELCENILNKINQNIKHDDSEIQLLLSKPGEIDLHLPKNVSMDTTDDQGEVISRDSLKKFMNNLPSIPLNPSVDKVRLEHCFENVIDRDSLRKFIENEETHRNIFNDKSLTSHLTFMQWQALKNSLLKFDNNLVHKNKFKMKLKQLWKDKCLDYV